MRRKIRKKEDVMSCSLVKARDRGKKNTKKNGKRTGEIKRI